MHGTSVRKFRFFFRVQWSVCLPLKIKTGHRGFAREFSYKVK